MYKLARSESQIDTVLNTAMELADAGENPYWGQTYAEGVEAGIMWAIGNRAEPPLDSAEKLYVKGKKK